ncbi:MAG: EAL domain-containing protein [Clostridiales bacterium]|nr:EAL domain-containing protein [Clostridiales bacterium]
MINAKSIQVAFLLFEAIFCFLAALLAMGNESHRRRMRFPLTLLNLLGGTMLLFDAICHISRGKTDLTNLVFFHVANSVTFLITALMPPVYAVYVTVRTFGDISLKKRAPARGRLLACFLFSIVASLLVIFSQVSGIYYTIDSTNNYHRGKWFPLSFVFPLICIILVVSILIQYRQKLGKLQLLALSSYLILPSVGMVFQTIYMGYSFMTIGVGLSALLIFFEGSLSKSNEIRHIARTEVRTGLPNEHGCVEWLNRMHNQPVLKEYTAIFFDLVKFSDINRKYGIASGNVILASYGLTLSEHLSKDELLARQYGNQFVAVVKSDRVDSFLKLLSGVPVSFYDKQAGDVRVVEVAARAGVFQIDRSDLDGEEIISCAAIALSMAKTNTGNQNIFMTRDLLNDLEKRREFENEIEQGLQKGEFVPFYQPKVDARTHTLCGAEALARWEHDGSIFAPSAFVSLMEENRSICNLDVMILEKVCRDLSSWIGQGLTPPTVSVNFSRRNLADPTIADRINEIIEKNSIPRHLIEIEVTETADEFPILVLKNFVDSLHRYGYLVSIDDFGCASSSLTLLREITFDTIKIDKGFVDKDFSKDLTILEYIVKMAKSLELQIVAEGIEHESQIRTLLDMGVTVIQGYYYDKPMPADAMKKRLESPNYEEPKHRESHPDGHPES